MKSLLSRFSVRTSISSTTHAGQLRLECAHKVDSRSNKMYKHCERVDNLALRLQEKVRLGARITESVKRKMSMGAKILQVGSISKIFKQNFSVQEGEMLLQTFFCYLSTTAGPISGFLFISTHKISFRSERSIKLSSPSGEFVRLHYKVSIPLTKISKTNESKNLEKPSRKYIEIVTVDNFDFWFMGFQNHKKSFNYLQHAISYVNKTQ